jgi:Ca-activated chloride channel homolog
LVIRFLLVVALILQAGSDAPAPVFRASVEVVRLSAIVRDDRGRFVRNLPAAEFQVFDGGRMRPITDFRQESAGLSVALLFDVSGSMEGQLVHAREAASLLLSNLDPGRDEAAVFRFDTRLDETAPFTVGLRQLPSSMSAIVPFGATSLYDAIAQTAERVSAREGRRRAVVVFTDGFDNASTLTGPQVSGIASSIDVPVYIVGVVSPLDDPTADSATPSAAHSPLAGALANLAAWTGGGTFVASSPAQRSVVARQIVDELRHQYLIAIASATDPGWHRLTVKMRNKELVAHTRSGYFVGHTRPETK